MEQLLTVYITVVEKENFTRAAEALHMTQPAVSQYIQMLERTMGACKIFCVKSKSWYNHFIQNGGLQNGKKETQPCKCSRYRPYF